MLDPNTRARVTHGKRTAIASPPPNWKLRRRQRPLRRSSLASEMRSTLITFYVYRTRGSRALGRTLRSIKRCACLIALDYPPFEN